MRTQSPLSRSETRFLHTLYQSYAGPLYRVAHHRLGDPYLAQDLVQTVFLAAAEKPHAAPPRKPLGLAPACPAL